MEIVGWALISTLLDRVGRIEGREGSHFVCFIFQLMRPMIFSFASLARGGSIFAEVISTALMTIKETLLIK